MIRADRANRLALLEAIAPITGAREVAHDYFELMPGARVRARVDAQLVGGGFRVFIAGTPMQMQLPSGIHPGAVLELIFIGGQPRPTFVLLNPVAAGSGAVLSPTARLIGALAQESKAGTLTIPPYQAAPVLDGAPADSGEFSARLRQAFAHSGLFYESHQAQWLAGRRTREELLEEPQGRLSVTPPRGKGAAAKAAMPLPATAQPVAREALERVIHKDAVPLVQQQLAVLDTGQMPWRGEVWPGQTMEWEIAGEPPERDVEHDPSRWHSRLKLVLPRLGTISALLVLDSRGVGIALEAGNAPVAAMLRAGAASLMKAMQESGLSVTGFEVRGDEPAPER